MNGIDYTRYGLDPAAVIPAVSEQNFLELTAKLIQAEVDLDQADDDPEDLAILEERVEDARAAVDAARATSKLTKAEAREHQRNILANNIRALAQEHLTHEANKASSVGQDLLDREVAQAVIENRIEVLERMLVALD